MMEEKKKLEDPIVQSGEDNFEIEPASTGDGGFEEIVWYRRHDIWAWFGGILFILALMGAMMGIGEARGWDAAAGHTHNTSATSLDRFLPEPYLEEPGVKWRSGADRTGLWYYWKLDPAKVTAASRAFMWIGYAGHQLSIWFVTYRAQVAKASRPFGEKKYTPFMDKYNWAAFGLNAFFHILHLINTHTTYDATAQDVSIASSQGSVIMALCFVIFLEYSERGLWLGWPGPNDHDKVAKKIRTAPLEAVRLMRKYHGYAISWAAIYTFWYHPMENTIGHAFGFVHTWLLVLQGSLMHTKFHQNKWWRFILEAWVTIHALLVALQTGDPNVLNGTLLWPMFLFGFLFTLCFTWIYIFPFWSKISGWFRLAPVVLYFAATIGSYSQILDRQGRPFTRLQEIIRIPGIIYIFFFVIWGFVALFQLIDKKINGGPTTKAPSAGQQVGLIFGFLFGYAVMIGVSIMFHVLDWQTQMFTLMAILVALFTIGVAATSVCLHRLIPARISAKIEDMDVSNQVVLTSIVPKGGQQNNGYDQSTEQIVQTKSV
ncbi:unnamed protein product [Owenia fusiformis]|uniref:Uncharacterized protein n=1 Tax=Owenia fusiformis TaxID=6347 RepID=A0A8J1U038_OWEFU|nr:unnamed protein product [Owenia fusiformis]